MSGTENTVKKRALLALRVGILAGLSAGIWYVGDRLDWVRGDSIPVTVAWISGGPVQKGDYVLFEAQHPIINEGRKSHLTKQVVCVEGQQLAYQADTFSCDGQVLGAVIHKTFDGTPIEVAAFNGVIPAGKVFVMGPHPRSFDSRYLGLLDRAQLTRVEPLL